MFIIIGEELRDNCCSTNIIQLRKVISLMYMGECNERQSCMSNVQFVAAENVQQVAMCDVQVPTVSWELQYNCIMS